MIIMKSDIYFCLFCGDSFELKFILEQGSCMRHPLGAGKGKHQCYTGGFKSSYQCRYCLAQADSIHLLTAGWCPNYPYKLRKGKHLPENN